MAVDLSALSVAQLTAGALDRLILVNPQKNIGIQPQLPDGSTGDNEAESFLFHYEGEQSVTLSSDITDHFAEDNKALQDQISIKPTTINTNGFIGELNDVIPKLLQPLKTVADKLTILDPFLPQVSATALIALNTAQQGYATALQVASAAVQAWDTISGGNNPVQNKQQLAFQKFFGYYNQRRLFTVQTPWAVFSDMAIQSLRAIQEEDTRVISTFEITFKKMRFAQTITGETQMLSLQGRAFYQGADVLNKGVSTPIPSIGAGAAIGAAFGGVA